MSARTDYFEWTAACLLARRNESRRKAVQFENTGRQVFGRGRRYHPPHKSAARKQDLVELLGEYRSRLIDGSIHNAKTVVVEILFDDLCNHDRSSGGILTGFYKSTVSSCYRPDKRAQRQLDGIVKSSTVDAKISILVLRAE